MYLLYNIHTVYGWNQNESTILKLLKISKDFLYVHWAKCLNAFNNNLVVMEEICYKAICSLFAFKLLAKANLAEGLNFSISKYQTFRIYAVQKQ